mgnify:CR=1
MAKVQAPFINIVLVERYLCSDSVVVVFTLETGEKFVILTPYN